MGFNSNMRVTPIMSSTVNNPYSCRKKEPTFTAHPDFYKYNSTKSCYFRRGMVALASAGYNNIESLFCNIFPVKGVPKNMLIIGIGHSQEPFSYLASIKGIAKDKPLKSQLNLNVVDLQSKPTTAELKDAAFCDLFDYQEYPKYAKSSFVKDSYSDWLGISNKPDVHDPMFIYLNYVKKPKPKTYRDRVNDEIFDFVKESYNDPQKSKWDSRVQEVILGYPDDKFDIISANNVLPYIESDREFIQTLKNIKRVLKPNGYFITDPYEYPQWVKDTGVLDNLTKRNKGIYQKTL